MHIDPPVYLPHNHHNRLIVGLWLIKKFFMIMFDHTLYIYDSTGLSPNAKHKMNLIMTLSDEAIPLQCS